MKLYRWLSILALLAAAACTSSPTAPASTPTSPPATATTVPAAAGTATSAPQATDTQAASAPSATLAAATATETAAPATATAEVTSTELPASTSTEALPTDTDTPAPAAETPTAPAPGTIIGEHTVQPGETVLCIARGYGVRPDAIAQVNGLVGNMFIFPGEKLNIPAVQWTDIAPGPVCAPQFASPFPGLPASTATPAASATASS